jgi:hypothetical protein
MPPVIKSDFDKAMAVKAEAAKDFKGQLYETASEKYYEILNIIRMNSTLKENKEG